MPLKPTTIVFMQINSVKKTVEELLAGNSVKMRHYHNLNHTIDVFEAAERLLALTDLPEETQILIRTAALLHETGMINSTDNHEEASVLIAKDMLPQYGYSKNQIDEIANYILATKMPQNPLDEGSKIICDADLDYLGRNDYFILSHKLRLEWIVFENYTDNLVSWYKSQIEFLEQHNYFTNIASSIRKKGKQHNLMLIKNLFQ